MSRRKQTKPFKVEDKPELKKDRKLKPRRILPKPEEEVLPQIDPISGNFSDGEEDSLEGRSKRGTKCDECGKVLASTLSLARHKLTHSESKPYQCPQCGAGFKTSSNMHRHLRIHFREMKDQSDTELVVNKPRTCTQRSPRQNIRTPNKFREFDVDLVGVGQRPSADPPTTYARAYSKAKDNLPARKQASRLKNGGAIDPSEENATDAADDFDSEELPDLNVPRMRRTSVKPEDLICHLCNKSFISKFGLLTHLMSHSDTSTETSNKCHLCDQSFTTPKGLVVHNVIVHKIAGHKAEAKKKERSFQDIAIVDFSAKKFPVVAEDACTKSHCGPPLRDTQHIFICKKCDKAFPLLRALEIHMNKNHRPKEQDSALETLENPEMRSILAALNMQNKTQNGCVQDTQQQPFSLLNGVDDDNIFTSKSVASEDTPTWLKEQPNEAESSYQKESDITPVRPKLNFERRTQSDTKQEFASPAKHFSSPVSNRMPPMRSISHNKRRTRNQVDTVALLRNLDQSGRQGDSDKGERNIFWCRICNYSSREKSALVRHLLTHSGIRPYFCKICDYAFTTKANCERHVRKRHNCVERAELDAAVRCDWEMLKKAPREDIYMISGSNSACPVCSESFSSNEELKRHLKVHEERHFLCQLCNVRCTTRNNCVRHILHKHPGIPHKEANNIITFVGNGRSELDIELSDIVQDKPEIDISKGRIGGKHIRSSKPLRNWPKSTFQNPRSSLRDKPVQHKKPRLGAPPSKLPEPRSIGDDEDSNIPMSLPESDEWPDNNDDTFKRSVKCLPFIPLLKIKAYNEAAARSYADMVALYQHLNFLNTAENDMMAMDDTIMPMMESPNKLDVEEDFAHGETMFICQSCGKSFNTEDGLNNHIVLCDANLNDAAYQMDENDRMVIDSDDIGQDDRASNVFLNDAAKIRAEDGANGDVLMTENAWDSSGRGDPLGIQVFGSSKNAVEGWPDHSTANSPFSMKSAEESALHIYDSPYTNERQLPISTSTFKESSYVEDSLLMTMFADDNANESYDGNDENGQAELSMSRYSSGLPTMVNMDSPTMTPRKFKGGNSLSSQLDDKDNRILTTNAKGKMYSGRKCPQCSKVFPWASSLRRHIMTHTGLKLYMCRLCKMRFTTRSNLIRHVYRRHGMAKQHPDFASCLAKLHPSDTLLREVEADVRRRIDGRKKRKTTVTENPGNYERDEDYNAEAPTRRKKGVTSDFQSMLEEDPETQLVDLDYSPRDELTIAEDKKQALATSNPQEETSTSVKKTELLEIEPSPPTDTITTTITTAVTEDDKSKDQKPKPIPIQQEEKQVKVNKYDKSENVSTEEDAEIDVVNVAPQPGPKVVAPVAAPALPPPPVPVTPELPPRPKNLRRRSEMKTPNTTPTKSPAKNSNQSPKTPKGIKQEQINEEPEPKVKGRNKQSSQFVCGLCKKIFKSVPELISHLDEHNVPHSWHCSVCGVPFTNKYNCQRHLTRRHGRSDLEPTYVEDLKHGPCNARGNPRKPNNEVTADIQGSK